MSHKKSKKGSKADAFTGFSVEEPDAINPSKEDDFLTNLIKNKGAEPGPKKSKKKKKKKSKGDQDDAPVGVPGASSRPDTTLETSPPQRERSGERRQFTERERSHSRGRADSERSQNRERSLSTGERRKISIERPPKRDRSFERPQYQNQQKPNKSNAPQNQKRQRNADEDRARQLQAAAARPEKNLFRWETHPHLIEEIQDDLFTVSDEYSLAHCVSEDFHMGKGIAVEFKKQFGGVGQLLEQGATTGGMAFLKDRKADRFIYYLVTKPKYNMKPTMMTLRNSVVAMQKHCVANGVTKLAMPAIGCGLDRLEWADVYKVLVSIFEDTGIHIKVYYLL